MRLSIWCLAQSFRDKDLQQGWCFRIFTVAESTLRAQRVSLMLEDLIGCTSIRVVSMLDLAQTSSCWEALGELWVDWTWRTSMRRSTEWTWPSYSASMGHSQWNTRRTKREVHLRGEGFPKKKVGIKARARKGREISRVKNGRESGVEDHRLEERGAACTTSITTRIWMQLILSTVMGSTAQSEGEAHTAVADWRTSSYLSNSKILRTSTTPFRSSTWTTPGKMLAMRMRSQW